MERRACPTLPNTPTDVDDDGADIELPIPMPCLGSAETLAACIDTARTGLTRSGVVGEVLIAGNGGTDGSHRCANRAQGCQDGGKA